MNLLTLHGPSGVVLATALITTGHARDARRVPATLARLWRATPGARLTVCTRRDPAAPRKIVRVGKRWYTRCLHAPPRRWVDREGVPF